MTTTKRTLLAASAGALALPVIALAQVNVGDTVGLTDEEINAALSAAGASVLNIERETDEIEVDYMLGTETFSIEIDLGTGVVTDSEIEDDASDGAASADDDDDDDDGEDDDDDGEDDDDDDDDDDDGEDDDD